MTNYRAYRLDPQKHIRSAEWLQAPTDEAALAQAEALCEEGAPTIEVWEHARLVDEIDCEEDQG